MGTSQRRADVESIRDLITWPSAATEGWSRGFLAGIFDAEGHYGQVIRISNKDPLILDAIGARDYPLVQGCVLVIGASYILVNTAADLLHRALDPRLRDAE